MKYLNLKLNEKMKEAIKSILPVYVIVHLLCFTLAPVSNSTLMTFTMGSILLTIGMGLFTLGAETAMTPIGEALGSHLMKTKNLFLIIVLSLLVGMMITIAEPDLQILASQVPTIPNIVLIGTVSIGVGFFLVAAVLRIFFQLRLSYLLLACYTIIFIISRFVPQDYLTVAFDSGGVTTGPMTVPFIMAFGIGIASIRSDRETANDTFGLVALSSIGPILAVLLLGIIYQSKSSTYVADPVIVADNSRQLWLLYQNAIPVYFKEVALALSPILLLFLLFQKFAFHLPKKKVISILAGMMYTCIGLTLFLTGANVGLIPAGRFLGQSIYSLKQNWILIPVGMLLGYFIVSAEPAVHVLNHQVEEITSGLIPARYMKLSLSIGVSISIGLAMFRTMTGYSIFWFLIIGYGIALILTFFVPPVFTAIAFDSGGVASGPMTATFLLAFSIGACEASGKSIVTSAFGIVAFVAMTPLITIQILGLIYRIRYTRIPSKTDLVESDSQVEVENEDDIIHF